MATRERTSADSPPAGFEVHTRGVLAQEERDCAVAMLSAVAAHHRIPGGLRVRMTGAAHPGGPMVLQVNLRVHGAPARIQVAGRTAAAAIASGAARLDRQIRRLTTAYEQWPWPDPDRRTLGLPGVARIVRHKTFWLRTGLPCQAVAVMNAMDYDVYLYTDAETGEDAIVYRAGPTGLRLARQRSMHPAPMPPAQPLTLNPRRVPVLSPAGAADRLAEGWLPFLFFTDAATSRGNLLYRRYDGDLGLISPVAVAGSGTGTVDVDRWSGVAVPRPLTVSGSRASAGTA